MARGHSVSPGQFIDYLPAQARGTRGSGKTGSPLGDLRVLPEDYKHLESFLTPYTQTVDEISRAIQSNPSSYRQYLPKIQQVSQDLNREMSTGSIAAMRDRYERWRETADEVMKRSDLDAEDKAYYISQIKVEDFNYDPETGRGGQVIAPPFQQSWTSEDQEKWFSEVSPKVKDKLLQEPELRRLGVIGDNVVGTVESRKGILVDQAQRILAGMIPKERLEHLQKKRQWRLDNGYLTQEEFDMFDETQIFDKNGKINPMTTAGKQIQGWADAIAREELQRSTISSDTGSSGSKKAAPAASYERMHKMIERVLWSRDNFQEVLGKIPGSKTTPGVSSVERRELGGFVNVNWPDGTVKRVPSFKLEFLDKNGKPVSEINASSPEGMEAAYWELFNALSNNPNEPTFSREAMEQVKETLRSGKTFKQEMLDQFASPQGNFQSNTTIEEVVDPARSKKNEVLEIE